ncbi:hypothetical protein V2J09_006207 [Rumex salicifolius]
MSPALIDSGLQSQFLRGADATSLVSRAQISIPASGDVGSSDRESAFEAMKPSDGVNPNFQFSAVSLSKPVNEKAAFGAVHGLSRPRMAKTRKSQHNRAMGGPEPRESVFHRADDGSSMFEVDRMTSGSNANQGVNLDTSILDEMRKLRLRDEKGAGMDGSLSSELHRLNLEHSKKREDPISPGKHFNVIGESQNKSQNNFGFGRGGDGSGYSSLPTGLPFDFKNLNIKEPGVAAGNGSSMEDAITYRMRNLNVEADSHNAKEETKLCSENTTFCSTNISEGSHFLSQPHSIIIDGLGKLKLGDELKESNSRTGLGKPSSQTAVQPDAVNIHIEGTRGFGIKSPQHQAIDETQSTHQFVFTSKLGSSATPYGDFSTPSPKGTSFTSFNQKVEFGARRETMIDNMSERMKAKSKESTLTQTWQGADTFPQECSFQDEEEPSESYSPMDISPYPEIVPDNQFSTETTLTSDKVAHIEEDFTSKACQSACGDTIDEDLISATESLGIGKCKETKFSEGPGHVSVSSLNETVAAQASSEESVSAVETESFKSANDFSDISGQIEEVSSSFNDEAQSRDSNTQFYSASSSESSEISFTFSASSSHKNQVAPAMRNQKKKNRTKVGQDAYHSLKDTLLSEASSTVDFSSFSRGSSPFHSRKEDIYPNHRREGPSLYIEKAQPVKQETLCPSATASAAKEACEKWRLRGNQAYSSGEFDKAEDCYTQGVNCISKSEASTDGLRALMLCYSNRAAIRMALGRFRDALADCGAAAKIDTNFYKVQVRTANCYLALGEVAEASQLMKLLQIGSEACADSKLIMEASEIIQKAQEVSLCIDHSAELLRYKTMNNAEGSLQVIDEGLAISPCSEKLLQMKADALFMMQRYLDVIQHCEQTLLSAEKNFPFLVSDNQLLNLDPCELLKKYCFRVWRYSFIFNSYYYLGKLEEGLHFLENQTDLISITDRCGTQVESLIPLLVPAREMLKHKMCIQESYRIILHAQSAGNAAYHAGKHAEAVENYTTALACRPESRPFAAVCFGNRAAAYQALGQILDAIADCNLAIALDRSYLKVISRRATLFEMIRDYREAAKDLQKLVSLITKQAEGKTYHSAANERPANSQADLRHAHMRLLHVEEQAVKEPLLDFYLILGVKPSATSVGLKKAYRKAALRHHPDKACQLLTRGENVDDTLWKEMSEEVQKEADRLFKMIGEVYSVLSDPSKRLRYDEEVRNGLHKTGGLGTSRMHSDGQSNYGSPRSSSTSGRSAWESPANPPNYWYEPSLRSSRFY